MPAILPRHGQQQWSFSYGNSFARTSPAGTAQLLTSFSQPRSWAITGVRVSSQCLAFTSDLTVMLVKNRNDPYMTVASTENVLLVQICAYDPSAFLGTASDVTAYVLAESDGYRISADMPVSLYCQASASLNQLSVTCTLDGFYVR